jgi:hypothetical protein
MTRCHASSSPRHAISHKAKELTTTHSSADAQNGGLAEHDKIGDMSTPSVLPPDEIVPPSAPRVPPAVKAKVVAYHLAGESNRKIAKTLGMSKDTVGRILREGQIGPYAKGSVEDALARAGLTVDALLAHAKQGLSATETKLATFEGKFTDERQVSDNTTQHKYWQDVAKIAGMFPREDATAQAALFVKMPITVLAPGHSPSCVCSECASAWEEQCRAIPATLPELADSD